MTRAFANHGVRRSHCRAGFTLIEILIAAVAGALILAVIYTVFTRAVQLRNSATARSQEIGMRTRAVSVIRNDLQNGFVSGNTAGLAATLEGSPQGQGSQFPGFLKFSTTTARSVDAQIHGDTQEVEYYIASDPAASDQKAGVLMRLVHNNLLGDLDEVAHEERLLSGIESMEVTFFDGSSWADTWSVPPDTAVPKAIRVRLLPHASAATRAPTTPIEIVVPWTIQPIPPL
jgi:type II secretion system protein J